MRTIIITIANAEGYVLDHDTMLVGDETRKIAFREITEKNPERHDEFELTIGQE